MTSMLPGFAQQNLKFGHVNTEEIFMALPELQGIQTQIEEEYKKQESNLTLMQEELKGKQESYMATAKTMTAEERGNVEKELVEMNQRIQNFYTLAQQQLQAKEQELKAPLLLKVQNAIQEVGGEQGFIYIFEAASGLPVYHSDKSIDVGPMVKAKLGIN